MKKGFWFYSEEKFKELQLDGIISLHKEDPFTELLEYDYSKALFISITVDQILVFEDAIKVFQKYLMLDIPIILFNRKVIKEDDPVTHSGKMIKDNFIFNSLMYKYGVINCYTFEELKFATQILGLGEFKKYASPVQLIHVNDDIEKVVKKEMIPVEESEVRVTSLDNMGNCIQYGKVTFVVDEMLSHAVIDVSENCYGDSMIVPNSRVFFKMLNQCIERMTRSFDFSFMALTTNDVFGNRVVLSETESRQMLSSSEIKIGKTMIVEGIEEVVNAANTVGYPVVMKVNSMDIPHKSDVGGVVVGIPNEEELRVAYENMMTTVKGNCPDAVINGVMVSYSVPKGYEIILGAYNHDVYGPVVMVGDGGVTTEIFKDVAYAPVPVNIQEARRMVESLNIYPILNGYRGAPKLDIDRLVKDIMALSTFVFKNIDQVKEIDINPLFLYEEGQGSCAVDALVVKKQ